MDNSSRNLDPELWQRESAPSYRYDGNRDPRLRSWRQADYQSQSSLLPMLSDNFIAGFQEDGRMSVVRRFFSLFVTFDLIFTTLLWLISVVITGEKVQHAFVNQVLHYSIYTSLFDIVVAALCRFSVLILFYALIYLNHWIVIALSTSCSCAFLISKVFLYDWTKQQEPVFQVLLVLSSFILAWGEAWFLDCRVIPQERYARNFYITATNPSINVPSHNRISTFLHESLAPESVANFYSPFESLHNSDDEEEQDEDYKAMGLECVKKAHALLIESGEWKVEKVTSKGDTITSTCKDRVGKIYKLTGKLSASAKNLLEEIFYNVEKVPSWNPTIVESKILRKIDNQTDISYQSTATSAGGMVQSRDFINLRCWRLFVDGKVESCSDNSSSISHREKNDQSDSENFDSPGKPRSLEQIHVKHEHVNDAVFTSLSKSLGAKSFVYDTEGFQSDDALSKSIVNKKSDKKIKSYYCDRVFITSAVSIDFPVSLPINAKCIRGQNIISCFSFREIENKPNECIFEWLLCLDLKGYIPKYLLEASYTNFMQDYMIYLRKHIEEALLRTTSNSNEQ